MPWAPVFWKHKSGLYIYTCPLGGDDFEVTARIRQPDIGQCKVSWGQPFDLHTLLHEFDDFCPPVKQILRLAASGNTQEFALFAGPRLQSMVFHGNTAFVGDASHAMLGNFGAGAAFALEDVYALAKALDWAYMSNRPLARALDVFDSVRCPHYSQLYDVVDSFATIKSSLHAEGLPIDDEIQERIRRISHASQSWMFDYRIDKAVEQALAMAEEQCSYAEDTSRYMRVHVKESLVLF
jgi:salicylate hydroxylase